MRRNKTFNIIVSLVAFLPLIIVVLITMVAMFNHNYTLSTSAELNNVFKGSLEHTMLAFGCNSVNLAKNILDKNVYLANGWGLPILPYFIGIFTNVSSIASNNASYLLFANWYLSYILLVYLIAFIPKILLTFINFGYNLCDRFTERSEKKW